MNSSFAAATVCTFLFWVGCENSINAEPRQPSVSSAPIRELKGLHSSPETFSKSPFKKPIRIASLNEAKSYFTGNSLAKISSSVDFEKQVVLLFAWKGSSRDRVETKITKSPTTQVAFVYHPGKTRDLRPHTRVFVLRKDVPWSTR